MIFNRSDRIIIPTVTLPFLVSAGSSAWRSRKEKYRPADLLTFTITLNFSVTLFARKQVYKSDVRK